jgi:hypothetical protein
MADELAAIAERIRQRRAAAGALNAQALAGARVGFHIGDRVFDSLSGLDGTVLGAGLADRLRVNDVRVKLDDAREVIRSARELLVRPVAG